VQCRSNTGRSGGLKLKFEFLFFLSFFVLFFFFNNERWAWRQAHMPIIPAFKRLEAGGS
jgi:hypothetical protein